MIEILSKINPLNGLDFLLQVKSESRNCSQIIFWWESRRILYNAIVGFIGFPCWLALQELIPHSSAMAVMQIVVFGFACNICYSLGWLTEILLIAITKIKGNSFQWITPGKTYAPICFKLGLWFTLFCTFLPVALWCVIDFCTYLGITHLADY